MSENDFEKLLTRDKSIFKYLRIVLNTIILLSIIFFIGIKVRGCLAIDSCLDKGCRWNYDKKECECE